MRPLAVALLALVAPLVATGCWKYSQKEELLLSVREFNEGIRWGKIEQTLSHLPLASREAFQARYQGMEDEVEVVQYEVTRVDYHPADDTATVRVDVEWNARAQGLVLRTIVEQQWSSKDGPWIVKKQRRVKGAMLPLFEEEKPSPPPAQQALR